MNEWESNPGMGTCFPLFKSRVCEILLYKKNLDGIGNNNKFSIPIAGCFVQWSRKNSITLFKSQIHINLHNQVKRMFFGFTTSKIYHIILT